MARRGVWAVSFLVSEVRFTPADDNLRATGLLGWAGFLLDVRLVIEGTAVRRTQSGRRALSFPCRDDGWGKRWHYVRPIDDTTRCELERQILDQIKVEA